jgi:hypothetical protein
MSATTLCFGCRAIEGVKPCLSDMQPGPDLVGLRWERFVCSRCGIEDVRITSREAQG